MSKALSYEYIKTRKNFGRQPMFSQVKEHVLDTILPDAPEQKKYGLRNPVNRECQVSAPQSEDYINTTRVIMENEGCNHSEGGWPKEVSCTEEEMTSRYRRRIERDDAYIDAVLGTYKQLSKCINQNNAIELYDMYYKGMKPIKSVEKTLIRLKNMYRDVDQRPIASLSWTFEEEPKLVVAYCDRKFPYQKEKLNKNITCGVWNLDNPNEPVYYFRPPSACWQATCSPANPSLIVGGLHDGRVCLFDIRSKENPIAVSPAHLAHRDPVTALVYLQSRLNIEFFSGSTDGACMWWDIRDFSKNIDYLSMSTKVPQGEKPSLANAEPITALQYDKSIPTKFLCGTDTGLVIGVNRKGKTYKEMITAVFEAHNGPVKAVYRSPCISKMFLTCGDWTSHIWSEDISSSPIITGIGSRHQINDAAWAPQRISSYMTVSADGVFRYWDLLRNYSRPANSVHLCKTPLLKVKPQEEGRVIAAADKKGIIYIMTLSDNLALSADADKQLLIQTYERETRREHILESRIKEIRLKQATAEKACGPEEELQDNEAVMKYAEEEFKKIVADEIRRTGYSVQPGSMRKR